MKNDFHLHKYCGWLLCLLLPTLGHSQDLGAEWIVKPILAVDGLEISPREDETRFLVKKGGKQGLSDLNGNLILPMEYDNVMPMTCGWIRATKGKTASLFNAKAENIGLPYTKFTAMNNGMAVVYKDSLCGLINMKGEELVPVRYTDFLFLDSDYVFRRGKDEMRYKKPPEFVSPNQKRLAAATKPKAFLPGLYAIRTSNNLNGLVNEKRDTVVPPLYKFGSVHEKGYIVASFDEKKWGVIDSHNKTLYPVQADKIGAWSKTGLLPVQVDKEWGLLRFPGASVVIPFGKYEYLEVYDPEKDILLAIKDKKQGLMNPSEKVLLPFEYQAISQASHVVTRTMGENKLDGFVYRPNAFTMAPMFRRVINLDDSLVIVIKDSLYAVLDAKNGREIIPYSTDHLEKKGPYYIRTKTIPNKNVPMNPIKVTSLYDRKGERLFGPDSVKLTIYPNGSYWVSPHYLDSYKLAELRDKDGKVISTFTNVGTDANDLYWISVSQANAKGHNEFRKYSYLYPPSEDTYYNSVDKAVEGLCLVKRNKQFGFTDKEGRVVIPLVLDAAEPSKDGYLRVKYQGKWGVLQNPLFDYFAQ